VHALSHITVQYPSNKTYFNYDYKLLCAFLTTDMYRIERIVLLDFIHRLVSQKIEELKIYTKYHNTHVHKIHIRVNY
jgi:hypothetical protein